MDYFKYFTKLGVASTTTFADGLTSSQEAPKRLKSVMINITVHAGNKVEGWLEREKVHELPDHLIDTQQVTDTTTFPLSMNKLNEIPVGVDMPVGTTFKEAITCAATPATICGAYRYEIIGA